MFRHTRAIENARGLRFDSTDAERRLWSELRSSRFQGVKFRRQHPIAEFIVDLCAPSRNLVIELDGGQHQAERAAYDAERKRSLERQGWHVLRFWNHDVVERLDAVLEKILRFVREVSPSPGLRPASPQGGEAKIPFARGRLP